MKNIDKIAIVFAVFAAVCTLIVLKNKDGPATASPPSQSNTESPKSSHSSARLPRLVDLGADKCIPCKLMAPILKELKKEYAGRLDVDFLDVWKDPDIAKRYRIKIIPTQIFFDSSGAERFRHEGFISKADILAKFKELGADFEKGHKIEKPAEIGVK